ncbi:hypothetical protein CTI12_AA257410 [Artemisia annua]|uniref:Uncharacterized protein n=1 Tax=Artemisia annua TaxID=35608 RepID=A0A2U1NK10_ARTAN|nr:hypothetical protein CTI12_AA257410 [Artemisia annua]
MQVTMNHSRRQLPPIVPRKPKERDQTFDFLNPSKKIKPPPKLAKPRPIYKPVPPRVNASMKSSNSVASPPAHGNMLLAGYLAHEFLSKGTLFGELYDPTRDMAEPAYSAASSFSYRTMRQPSHGSASKETRKTSVEARLESIENKYQPEPQLTKNQRYVEVSELLKIGGHIPGIVNPSQLARFLHLQDSNKRK